MGYVRVGPGEITGPPKELMIRIRDERGATTFVETGTFHGDTAAWAAGVFGRVVTIERDPDLHRDSAARLGGLANVECVQGDSRAELQRIAQTLETPTIFWLDAHWSGGRTYGHADECPLLDELGALAASEVPRYLFIDDARFFLRPPPPPHDPASWPTLTEVVQSLGALGGTYVAVLDDVIVAVPATGSELVVGVLRTGRSDTLPESKELRRALRLMATGARMVARHAVRRLPSRRPRAL